MSLSRDLPMAVRSFVSGWRSREPLAVWTLSSAKARNLRMDSPSTLPPKPRIGQRNLEPARLAAPLRDAVDSAVMGLQHGGGSAAPPNGREIRCLALRRLSTLRPERLRTRGHSPSVHVPSVGQARSPPQPKRDFQDREALAPSCASIPALDDVETRPPCGSHLRRPPGASASPSRSAASRRLVHW